MQGRADREDREEREEERERKEVVKMFVSLVNYMLECLSRGNGRSVHIDNLIFRL